MLALWRVPSVPKTPSGARCVPAELAEAGPSAGSILFAAYPPWENRLASGDRSIHNVVVPSFYARAEGTCNADKHVAQRANPSAARTVKSLNEQMQGYAAYHQKAWNRFSHFFGVPLVTFSLLVFLAWFRFVASPGLPVSAATLFYVAVLCYYLRLDWKVGLMQAPFGLAILWLAERAAALPFGESLLVFAAAFCGGSLIQLLGHLVEGRRPALADNILQVFNAPLFLIVELMNILGTRKAAPVPHVTHGPMQ